MESNENDYTWDALKMIVGTSLIGALAAFIYGLTYSVGSGILALLATLLGYGIGGLGGFLFGFPRYTESAVVGSQEDLRKALSENTGESNTHKIPGGLHASTNLERIVDWLMTMIIGATLVNLQQLVGWVEQNCRALTGVLLNTSAATSSAVPGALVALPFMIAGFLHLYLWSRRYLLHEWTDADALKLAQKVNSFAAKQNELLDDVSRLSTEIFKVNKPTLLTLENQLRSSGAEDGMVVDVIKRLGQAVKWDDEPFTGFATPQSGDFKLSATVRDRKEDSPHDPYEVTLNVQRVDGMAFSGHVVFLFHNTFDTPFAIVEIHQRPSTTYTVFSSEAFIVAALVVQSVEGPNGGKSTTKLALDLAELPDAPKEFKSIATS